MSIPDIFRLLATEFSQISNDTLTNWIELTTPLVSAKLFGNLYDQAVALLVAHRLKLAGFGLTGSTGSITDMYRVVSYSEGETSVKYSASRETANLLADGELALTQYGLQFLSLRRMRIIPIISSGETLI